MSRSSKSSLPFRFSNQNTVCICWWKLIEEHNTVNASRLRWNCTGFKLATNFVFKTVLRGWMDKWISRQVVPLFMHPHQESVNVEWR
jgi:hypothetical protein